MKKCPFCKKETAYEMERKARNQQTDDVMYGCSCGRAFKEVEYNAEMFKKYPNLKTADQVQQEKIDVINRAHARAKEQLEQEAANKNQTTNTEHAVKNIN